MTSGFLSSISYKSSTLERRGSAAFSLSARSPGREGLPLFWARTRSAPTITMATTRSTATTPIRIPKTGLSSKGTGVPALKDRGHHNTFLIRQSIVVNNPSIPKDLTHVFCVSFHCLFVSLFVEEFVRNPYPANVENRVSS